MPTRNNATINEYLNKSYMNGSQAVENKFKIERQNFKVKPDKDLHNSATKKIGDRTQFVANIID